MRGSLKHDANQAKRVIKKKKPCLRQGFFGTAYDGC
jgi:hypothetical protein